MIVRRLVRALFPSRNEIRIDARSVFTRASKTSVIGCHIELNNSQLILGPSAKLVNVRIVMNSGKLIVGESTSLEEQARFLVTDGSIEIGKCSYVRSSVIVRFGGACSIGDYTTINHDSEIRCDERVSIGSFNMISYQCQINDTNTHNILPIAERRAQTLKEYSVMGGEHSKPPTKPVTITDDCWLGKGVTVLKGVTIGRGAVIGTRAVVTKDVPEFTVAAGNPAVVVRELDKNLKEG